MWGIPCQATVHGISLRFALGGPDLFLLDNLLYLVPATVSRWPQVSACYKRQDGHYWSTIRTSRQDTSKHYSKRAPNKLRRLMSARIEIKPDSLITVEADELSTGNDRNSWQRYITAHTILLAPMSLCTTGPLARVVDKSMMVPNWPELVECFCCLCDVHYQNMPE